MVSCVIPDDYSGSGVVLVQVGRYSRCGLRDGDAVHAVWSGSHGSANPGGAKRQWSSEGVCELVLRVLVALAGLVEEAAEFGACRGVGILG